MKREFYMHLAAWHSDLASVARLKRRIKWIVLVDHFHHAVPRRWKYSDRCAAALCDVCDVRSRRTRAAYDPPHVLFA